jgi:hypothetical protein
MSELFVVECINMDGLLPNRTMVGPFLTFGEAHAWMEGVGAKRWETLLIHPVVDPGDLAR